MRHRILFADDDLITEPYLVVPLQENALEVDTATNGYDAYVKLSTPPGYSAVILDNMMPPGDDPNREWTMEATNGGLLTGLMLLEKIEKGLEAKPKVWILTAFPDSETEDQERRFSFVVRIVKKPYELAALAAEILAHLEKNAAISGDGEST